MNLPRVYIQIPHYNNAVFLEDCISSVCDLDYPNLYVNIVNDHSTDSTLDLLDSINLPPFIQIITNSERLGRVRNYQHAFSLRNNSEWFINLDSDDYYTSTKWISEALTIYSCHPQDNIAHIQSNFLSRVGSHDIDFIKEYGNGYYLISGFDYIKLCIKHYGFSHLGSIFNVYLLEKYGAYTDDCLHTDFFTAARASTYGNVLIGSEEIGVWRKHDGNQSNHRYSRDEYNKNQVAYYRFFEWCENFIPYDHIKDWINILENRELDRKVMTAIKQKNLDGIQATLKKEEVSLLDAIKSIYRLVLIDNDTAKVKNIGHGVLTRGLSVFITLLSLPFILELIGVEDYSWIGIFTTIASAMYIFDFGLTNIITKEIVQAQQRKKESLQTIIASQEIIYLCIGIVVFSLLYCSSEWLYQHWIFHSANTVKEKNILNLVAIAILSQWPHSFYTGALFGLGAQTLSNYFQLGLTLFKNIGLLTLFSAFEPSIELFFYWQITTSILTILIQKTLIYEKVPYINPFHFYSWKYLHQLKHLAVGISFISLFCFVYSDVNNFLLAKWLSKSDFGYYSILYNIVMAYIMYCATIKSALFPYISKITNSRSTENLRHSYIKHYQMITYSLVPLSFFFIVFSYDFLSVWLNRNEVASYLNTSFKWIILGSLLNSLMIIPWTYMIAESRTKILIFTTALLAIISIPMLYLLIVYYHFVGASLYWFGINLIPLPVILFHFHKQNKVTVKEFFQKIIAPPFIISATLLIIEKLCLDFFQLRPLSQIVFATIMLLISYILVVLVNFFIIKHKI